MVKRRNYSAHELQNLALGEAVLELRIQGIAVSEISRTLQVTESEVHHALSRIIGNLRERGAVRAEEYRTLQDERLNRLLKAIWPKAMKGNVFAIDRVLRILDVENKLFGLYAPKKIAALYADLSGAALDQALEDALKQLSDRREGKIVDGEFSESEPIGIESGLDDLDGRSEEGSTENSIKETGPLPGSELSS